MQADMSCAAVRLTQAAGQDLTLTHGQGIRGRLSTSLSVIKKTFACRDTESMTPEIPEPKLVNIGPESSGGAPADKVESACGTDELFHDPFQVSL